MPEEKVYTSMYSRNAELYHHGVKGQKWGVENGPPYPLSDEVSTGKRLKKIEKLEKKSELNRGYMKKNEDYYKNKTDREVGMRKNDRDKKIEKANKKFEKQSSKIEKHNERSLKKDLSYKYSKEDALKAEIKMKKLLAKENGGKYRYKDMTDEEKAYYRKSVENKIGTAAWVTLVAASAAAGAYEMHEAKRGDDYSDYGINRRPSKETRKEIAKGQLERGKEATIEKRYPSAKVKMGEYSNAYTSELQRQKQRRDAEEERYNKQLEKLKKARRTTSGEGFKKYYDKEIRDLQENRKKEIEFRDKEIKNAEDGARLYYKMTRNM